MHLSSLSDSGNCASRGLYECNYVRSPMHVPCCAGGSEPEQGFTCRWKLLTDGSPCASIRRALEAAIFTIRFFCLITVHFPFSLSQSTFRLYSPTFMYLILGLWSGGWQCLLAAFLTFSFKLGISESSLPSYFLNIEVVRAQENLKSAWHNLTELLTFKLSDKGTGIAGEKKLKKKKDEYDA